MTIKRKPVALIIDDEKSICDTLSGIFSDEGWDSISAYSGKDGIDLFKKNNVDVVFLDVWMQHMDGIQTLQELKHIKTDVPIIVMSGHGTIETAVKATKLGAFDFHQKPVAINKLIKSIENCFDSKDTK